MSDVISGPLRRYGGSRRRRFRRGGAPDQIRPHRLPESGLGRKAAADQLHHAGEAFGQLGIGRCRGDLILPQFDIAAGEGFEIRRLRHE